MESKPDGVLGIPAKDCDLCKHTVSESASVLSANTEDEQKLIDEIVRLTSEIYSLDYAK